MKQEKIYTEADLPKLEKKNQKYSRIPSELAELLERLEDTFSEASRRSDGLQELRWKVEELKGAIAVLMGHVLGQGKD